MPKILFVFLLFFTQIKCLDIHNEKAESNIEDGTIFQEPGISETHFLTYKNETKISFGVIEQGKLQINIYSINCNFKVDFTGELLNQFHLEAYSFIIDSENRDIKVIPLIDIIDGEYKENYDKKSCPLIINSFFIDGDQPKLKIENKEENYFYLSPKKTNITSLNILYQIKDIYSDSFIALYFQYNEKSPLNINITYQNDNNKNNTDYKKIEGTQNIFLNSEFFLFNESEINIRGNLSIVVDNLENKTLNIHFKIIEKNTISLIKKNYLNFGFITSQLSYHYYYTEVLNGEEGELMLHNKRIYGTLYAKIVEKSKITREDLKNPLTYPNQTIDDNNSSYLKYNPHGLHLNFSYDNTSHCFNGCYLLITFEQIQSNNNADLIGFEFTILLRTWNITDYGSQIVDIPFNEYIIGAFHKGSITHHYYSISLPDDFESLIIQIEGNYLDGFYWEGRKKINTEKAIGKTAKLDIISNKNLLTLNRTSLHYTENAMSFAFRPKDTYADIFVFYYFRILYKQKGEKLYLPIDSQFGNLCLPEFDNIKNKYYCDLKLTNNKNYNALSKRFSISSSMQSEYFTINTTKVYTNGKTSSELNEYFFLSNNISKELNYFLFHFEFPNKELKNIIACFSDKVTEIHPQIYSSQMFYLSQTPKTSIFKLKNKYNFNYIHVYGSGNYKVNFLNFETFWSNRNFKGKPLTYPIESESEKIVFNTSKVDYIFYFQLFYSMKNKGVEEIISGETKNQFLNGGFFPLYYYLKIKNKNYINLDVNLRINSYNEDLLQNDFDVKGYLLDEDSIKRKINGENIKLPEAINGNYTNIFQVGLLQVNQKLDNNYNYLLIEIKSNEQRFIDSYLLVELITKEYNDNNDAYFLPINKYILETFDDENGQIRTENKYYVSSKYREEDAAYIEYSTAYDDIQIEFENITSDLYQFDYFNGFRKYWVKPVSTDNVYFSVKNPKKRNTNYMIRYFYTGRGGEYIYNIDLNYERKNIRENNENVSISLTFNAIGMIYLNKPMNSTKYPGIFFNIFGLLYKPDYNSEEQLNTTSLLTERTPSHESHIIHNYSEIHPEKWTITFENIPRVNNFIYELQLKIYAIIPDYIFNEEYIINTTKVDLSDIRLKDKFPYWWVIIGVSGFIALALIIFFVIKYLRLNAKKKDLEEEMKSFAYSNDIQKNVIMKDKQHAEKDNDYDTTFI